jgi:hypothetical protein
MDTAPRHQGRFREISHNARKVSCSPMPCRTDSVRYMPLWGQVVAKMKPRGGLALGTLGMTWVALSCRELL